MPGGLLHYYVAIVLAALIAGGRIGNWHGGRADGKPFRASTSVSVSGTNFLINGAVTHPATPLEGTLPNSRMVQATFDDANPATAPNWNYPGGGWNPARNLDEFIQNLPSYRARGLLAVTLNFQGGGPKAGQFSAGQIWDNSAFDASGNLKPGYLSRMDRAIRALDSNGMVAIVGFFYFGQIHRLSPAGASETNDPAVLNAVDQAADWLVRQGYHNVLVEIANESDNGYYSHPMVRPAAVATLIARVRDRAKGKLLVSTSFTGGYDVPQAVLDAEDYVLIHGNNLNASELTAYIRSIRGRTGKPVIVNEDSTSIANFRAATAERVSWGYYDQGENDYVNGFQSPPVNWAINTGPKKAFFDQLSAYLGGSVPKVTSLSFADAESGRILARILDGATVDLGALPARNLALRADTTATGSVRFDYDGFYAFRTESRRPFLLGGPEAAWTPDRGPHVLVATPFADPGGAGPQGKPLTIRFTVLDSAGGGPVIDPAPAPLH